MKWLDNSAFGLAPQPPGRQRLAIIGAGFSGTLLAINLLEQPGLEVILIERDPTKVARGVAYGGRESSHRLNVRAANMSAFAVRPHDFVEWLARRDGQSAATKSGSDGFVTRSTYGQYLADTLNQAMVRHGSRLTVLSDTVLDIAEVNGRASIGLASGGLIDADKAILAQGNLPPHDTPGIDGAVLPKWRYVANPWSKACATGLEGDDPVLLVGTGLTAIDVILDLVSAGFTGPIIAQSRRGLRPQRHLPDQPRPQPLFTRPANSLSGLLAWVRAASEAEDWRQAVDALRPVTQLLWASADQATRARFLRHLRPWWDIHRHRIAPQVAERIDSLVSNGQLQFRAGSLAAVVADRNGVHVQWRARGDNRLQSQRVQRVINCTGPQGDLLRTSDPLLRRLLTSGAIRPDALHLGLDVDPYCRVIDRTGSPAPHLLAVGPMTRGDLWEVVAVPDIRHQVAMVARRLTNDHWVGGEGL